VTVILDRDVVTVIVGAAVVAVLVVVVLARWGTRR
jgi:hypothetical protein